MNASKANFLYNDLDENFEYDNAGLYEMWDNQRPSIEEGQTIQQSKVLIIAT